VTTTRASGAEIFRDRVAEACADGVPLGAYADDHALHYLFLAAQGPYALSHRFDETRIAKAVSGACPALAWDEREMAQERAVHFEDLPDPRPFRWHDGAMPPAVVAHGSGLMHFVVGPVHAGIIEPGRFTFSSGGETLVHLDAQLGYSYRGVERALEGGSAAASAPKVARICGGCSASHSFGYALALEALAGVRVCAEVDLARLVIAELERIYNHVADLAASSAGTGWGVGFARGMALKEEAMRLCAIAGGHRLLFDAVVPGGVAAFALDDRRRIAVEVVKLESHSERFVHALFGQLTLAKRRRARARDRARPRRRRPGASSLARNRRRSYIRPVRRLSRPSGKGCARYWRRCNGALPREARRAERVVSLDSRGARPPR
jgi:hypothetical protein